MEIIIKAAQLLLSLSILVVLHELGHFIPAKLFKTRVEKFYLFFDPWFSIFKKKFKGTEYGVGWLPLGGYVKISGMIDESMDVKQMSSKPEPWEFRAKPAWQRLIIMVGGVVVNVILAFFIYIAAFMVWGDKYLDVKDAKYGIYCDSLGLEAGFKNGDKILSIDNRKVDRFSQIIPTIILDDASVVSILREDKKTNVFLSEEIKTSMLKEKNLFSLAMPFVFGSFSEASAVESSGGKIGDKIISVNGRSDIYLQDIYTLIPSLKGDTIILGVERKGETINLTVFLKDGLLGVMPNGPENLFDFSNKKYSLFDAIPAGLNKTFVTLNNYIKQFKLIKKSPESVGGFITIGNIFPEKWDWKRFWELTAFLSIMLAVLNILPIPALDGGHVMFLTYELVTGKKPKQKVLEYAQVVGMILLLLLVVYANGNDLIRLFS